MRAYNGNNVPDRLQQYRPTVTTPAPLIAPKMPGGFYATGQAIGSSYRVTYNWRAVTERIDGSALTNLAGYEIYASSNILAPQNEWVLITTVTATSWSTTGNPNDPEYYALRAIDTSGLNSSVYA